MTEIEPSRRYLLAAAGILAGSALWGSGEAKSRHKTHAHKAPAKKGPLISPWPLGVQLWAVNAQMKTDIPGTLKALKDLGFVYVETAGIYGGTAQALAVQIRDAGLKCRAYHTNMGTLIDDKDSHIANAQALGASWLVCSSPRTTVPLDPAKPWVEAMTEAMTLDAWKDNANHIAELAPAITASGLKFAYHNHPMEFKDLGGGVTGYDLLAQSSDLLRLEMDIGWVQAGGANPVAMIRKYAGRIDLLHIKDMKKDPAGPLGYRSVEVGQGEIDWTAVLKAAHAAKVSGFFIEQEEPFTRPIFESLKMSIDYLHTL